MKSKFPGFNVGTRRRLSSPLRIVLAVVLGFSACARKPTPTLDPGIAGTYTLVSVDGKPVPAAITHDGAHLQVRAGALTIHADGTCNCRTVFVPPSGREITREVSATCTMDGPNLTMRWKGAGRTAGTIQGHTFRMNNEGTTFVYTR